LKHLPTPCQTGHHLKDGNEKEDDYQEEKSNRLGKQAALIVWEKLGFERRTARKRAYEEEKVVRGRVRTAPSHIESWRFGREDPVMDQERRACRKKEV